MKRAQRQKFEATAMQIAVEVAQLEEDCRDLLAVLSAYTREFKAFRSKPMGAPHSPVRAQQDNHIALEDRALALIKRIQGG